MKINSPRGQQQEGCHHQEVEHIGERVEPDDAEDLAEHVEDHRHGAQRDGRVGRLEDVLALVVRPEVDVRLVDLTLELKNSEQLLGGLLAKRLFICMVVVQLSLLCQ